MTRARTLIVEHGRKVQPVFRPAVEGHDYSLTVGRNGEPALTWLRNIPVDLVLLDLQMPEISGIELLRRLRTERNGVPAIIITAHGSIPDMFRAVKVGADDYVTKPIPPDALRSVVADELRRHGTASRPSTSSELSNDPGPSRTD
jgi:DNA-binding response OmpR family regulator